MMKILPYEKPPQCRKLCTAALAIDIGRFDGVPEEKKTRHEKVLFMMI